MKSLSLLSSTSRAAIAGLALAPLLAVGACGSNSASNAPTAPASGSSAASASSEPSTPDSSSATPVAAGDPNTCPPAGGAAQRATQFASAPKMCIDANKKYTATMTTDVGDMTIALDAKAAPKAVNNFVFLARNRFYDGLTFHRVIPGFMLQGGDPAGDGSGGPGYEFADELPKKGAYKVGSLAMANAGPNTQGSQFFVITGDAGVQLPPDYTLFGQVTTGMDVAKKIEADGAADPTDQAGTPQTVHTIKSVTISES